MDMQISVIDVETIVMQRDLEVRRHMRTDYESAMILAGQRFDGRTVKRVVASVFDRLRSGERA
jgi:hypothetical protein